MNECDFKDVQHVVHDATAGGLQALYGKEPFTSMLWIYNVDPCYFHKC